MSVLILIPVLDEADTIGRVIAAARAHGAVLVVDDGSHDGSGELAAAAGAEVLRHPRPLGKAQALRTGVAAARRRGATRVVTLDGDGQHDPDAIPALLAAADAVPRAIVVGNRLESRDALPARRRNAVRVASFFAGWTCGQPIADSQSGFRVYPLAVFDETNTRHGGFVFETEILVAAAARGWAIEEVRVPASARVVARSHFRPLRDGAAIGLFLTGRVLARWAREARSMAVEMHAVFDGRRMAARHAAVLQEAAGHADSPARWSVAIGVAAGRRAATRLGSVCADIRRRGVPAAAVATLLAPVTLPLLLTQALTGSWLPDFVTPLVDAVYGSRRVPRARGAHPVDVAVAEPVTEAPG